MKTPQGVTKKLQNPPRPEAQTITVEVRYGTSPINFAKQFTDLLRRPDVNRAMLDRMQEEQLDGNVAIVVQNHRGQDPAVTLGVKLAFALGLLSESMGWKHAILIGTTSHMADYRRAAEAIAIFPKTPGTMFQSDVLERQPASLTHTFVAFLHDSPTRLIAARQLRREFVDLIDVIITVNVLEMPAPKKEKERPKTDIPVIDQNLDGEPEPNDEDLAAMGDDPLFEEEPERRPRGSGKLANRQRAARRKRARRGDRQRLHHIHGTHARR